MALPFRDPDEGFPVGFEDLALLAVKAFQALAAAANAGGRDLIELDFRDHVAPIGVLPGGQISFDAWQVAVRLADPFVALPLALAADIRAVGEKCSGHIGPLG